MNSRRLRLILLIFWLILAGLIVWLKVAPWGSATYQINYPVKHNLLGGKGFIGQFTPLDRVEINSGQMAKISGDPVYFSVFTPRTFSEAKITITYQNNLTSSTPIIEAGVLVDNIVWRYKLASLENKIIDENFKNWNELRDGNILLLQKNKNFSTVSDFLNTLKNKEDILCPKSNLKNCLAIYNIDSLSNYFPEDLLPKSVPDFKAINVPLQGTHQFYFIASGDKELKFDLDFVDLNLNKQSDPIIISIYKQDTKIYSTTIADDFGTETSGQVRNFFVPLSYQSISSSSNLYKLEIKAGEDVVIKKITKAPSALNVIGRLHPVTVPNLPLSLWTDSSVISVTTNNPASRQTLKYGNSNFSLPEPYLPYEFESEETGLKKISLNRDDVILSSNGIFSFSSDDFFNPEFKKLDKNFILNQEIEYVLAEYPTPQKINNNLMAATVILNTKEAYREKGKYSFIISVPGLSLVNQGNLMIKSIKVEFSGRNVLDKIKEKLLSYVN